MSDPSKRKSIRPSPRAGWTYTLLSLGALVLTVLLTVIPLYFSLQLHFQKFIELGLLQPIIAALLALSIVLGVRVSKGRFVNERRKGGSSPSSATIAVRLWAICFTLLAGAMLLFALLPSTREQLLKQPNALPKTVETQIEVQPTGAPPAVTSVKVTQ